MLDPDTGFLLKSNYVRDPDTELLIKRAAMAINRTPCRVRMPEREVMKSDYKLDPDTELLIKRAATDINRTLCCAG